MTSYPHFVDGDAEDIEVKKVIESEFKTRAYTLNCYILLHKIYVRYCSSNTIASGK